MFRHLKEYKSFFLGCFHSYYFSKDAFAKLKGDNKELLTVKGAVHIDLYDDKAGVIPYDKIEEFRAKTIYKCEEEKITHHPIESTFYNKSKK